MNKITAIIILITTNAFATNYDWGKTGHRVVGEVASSHLTTKAKRGIEKLLGVDDLALVANFADDIKSDNRYREFSAWHYVNFETDYENEPKSKDGDIITGINYCIEVIKNKSSLKADKIFYLKMLVHLIGDLHQPLHVGRASDKGGNDIQVRWFNDGSNLHRVWDENMIDFYAMSYTELAQSIDTKTKKEIKQLQAGSLLDWVYETKVLANKVYASAEVGEKLRYDYMYLHFDTVKQQLQKGGLRLAKVLNELFS